MEQNSKSINISEERLLKLLKVAYDIGNNGQNMTLTNMLEFLESKLIDYSG